MLLQAPQYDVGGGCVRRFILQPTYQGGNLTRTAKIGGGRMREYGTSYRLPRSSEEATTQPEEKRAQGL